MDKKYLFNSIAHEYDVYRPNYFDQVYNDIFKYSDIKSENKVIEIGCGTGQATKPFLDKACQVVAIEPGSELAAFTQRKYEAYDNLAMRNTSFEDFVGTENRYDLIYSATAFHWIPSEIGYIKVNQLLKKGGTIALFWNRPSKMINNETLYAQLQKIYKEHLGELHAKRSKVQLSDIYKHIQNDLNQFGFNEIQSTFYNKKRMLAGEEYIGLLETYSDYIALPHKIKAPLFDEVLDAITEHGGRIEIEDQVDLHMAKK